MTRAPRRSARRGTVDSFDSPSLGSPHPSAFVPPARVDRGARAPQPETAEKDSPRWMQVARPRLSGRPGKRGNASRPSGSVLRARIDRSKGCARASAEFRTREFGTARKRAGIVAEVVRRRSGPEKHRAHHSTELVPRRDRGPSPRAEAAWRHVARSRGERLFLQGEHPRKGMGTFGKRACEEASLLRRTTAAKSWDRPGAGRLLPSRKRGPEGARWVTERGKAPRIVKAACGHAQAVEAVSATFDES